MSPVRDEGDVDTMFYLFMLVFMYVDFVYVFLIVYFFFFVCLMLFDI